MSETLSLDEFLRVVGQLKFRGTSVLFRLSSPPVHRSHSPLQTVAEPVSPSFASKRRTFALLEMIKDEAEDMDTSECLPDQIFTMSWPTTQPLVKELNPSADVVLAQRVNLP